MEIAMKTVKENTCEFCRKGPLERKEDGIQYWWLCSCGATTVPSLKSKALKGKQLRAVIGAYDRTKGKQAKG